MNIRSSKKAKRNQAHANEIAANKSAKSNTEFSITGADSN